MIDYTMERDREREREYRHTVLYTCQISRNGPELSLVNGTVQVAEACHTPSFNTAHANRKHSRKQLLNFSVNGAAECPYTAPQCTELYTYNT